MFLLNQEMKIYLSKKLNEHIKIAGINFLGKD